MKKLFLLLILFFASISVAHGKQTDEWLKQLENPTYESDRLKDENLKSKYLKYDFSTLLTPRYDFFGYIDPNYRRIKIYFTSISKNQHEPDIYNIKGISIVANNKCTFEGEIKVKQIREYKNMHFGCDEEFKDAGFKAQGILFGEYNFKENPKQKYSGVFEGVMTLYWYVDKHEIIHYDDIESFRDGYKNNQYIGTWSMYGGNTKKTCNWGEYRIPFSGDLDIGAGDFGVNPKYYNRGWEEFRNK